MNKKIYYDSGENVIFYFKSRGWEYENGKKEETFTELFLKKDNSRKYFHSYKNGIFHGTNIFFYYKQYENY